MGDRDDPGHALVGRIRRHRDLPDSVVRRQHQSRAFPQRPLTADEIDALGSCDRLRELVMVSCGDERRRAGAALS